MWVYQKLSQDTRINKKVNGFYCLFNFMILKKKLRNKKPNESPDRQAIWDLQKLEYLMASQEARNAIKIRDKMNEIKNNTENHEKFQFAWFITKINCLQTDSHKRRTFAVHQDFNNLIREYMIDSRHDWNSTGIPFIFNLSEIPFIVYFTRLPSSSLVLALHPHFVKYWNLYLADVLCSYG